MSYRISLDAPIKFNPTPPALELSRNTTEKRKKHVTDNKVKITHQNLYTDSLDICKVDLIEEVSPYL